MQSGWVLTKKTIKEIDSTHVFVVTFQHSGLRYIYFAFLCGTPPSNRVCGLCTFKIAHNADWLVIIPLTQDHLSIAVGFKYSALVLLYYRWKSQWAVLCSVLVNSFGTSYALSCQISAKGC